MVKLSGATAAIHEFIVSKTMREPEVLKKLREETQSMGWVRIMQIPPDQGQFMATLVKLMRPKKIVEVGVFTGYSSLAMALALPKDEGKIIALDVSEEWTNIAKRYWVEAGVEDKIDLRLAPAEETLSTMLRTEAGTIDMAFIDADKESYCTYYDLVLKLLRPGGLLLVDNMLWDGKIADLSVNDADTVALRKLHQVILEDSRVSSSMLTLGDGVFFVVKL